MSLQHVFSTCLSLTSQPDVFVTHPLHKSIPHIISIMHFFYLSFPLVYSTFLIHASLLRVTSTCYFFASLPRVSCRYHIQMLTPLFFFHSSLPIYFCTIFLSHVFSKHLILHVSPTRLVQTSVPQALPPISSTHLFHVSSTVFSTRPHHTSLLHVFSLLRYQTSINLYLSHISFHMSFPQIPSHTSCPNVSTTCAFRAFLLCFSSTHPFHVSCVFSMLHLQGTLTCVSLTHVYNTSCPSVSSRRSFHFSLSHTLSTRPYHMSFPHV